MAIDKVTMRDKNTGHAIYTRTSFDMIDDVPNFVTSDDLNGKTSTWKGVTTNIKLKWGSIKYQVRNEVLYIVGGGALAEDPNGDLFFSIPGISGRISATVLYALNDPSGAWNRLIQLNTDGSVTQWNGVKDMAFTVNAAIPLDN